MQSSEPARLPSNRTLLRVPAGWSLFENRTHRRRRICSRPRPRHYLRLLRLPGQSCPLRASTTDSGGQARAAVRASRVCRRLVVRGRCRRNASPSTQVSSRLLDPALHHRELEGGLRLRNRPRHSARLLDVAAEQSEVVNAPAQTTPGRSPRRPYVPGPFTQPLLSPIQALGHAAARFQHFDSIELCTTPHLRIH